MNKTYLTSYYNCMNKIFDYIECNLTEDLSLSELSKISGYSEYHFHRIFHAMTGQTPHDYVIYRKVVIAATRLLYEQSSITQIALDCGFSSSSSFVRSFRKYMNCSPSFYRNNKTRKRPVSQVDFVAKKYNTDTYFDSLLSIVYLQDVSAVGIVSKGLSENFENDAIFNSFKRLFKWIEKQDISEKNITVMGITLDSPEVVTLSECRYFACIPARAEYEYEGEISLRNFSSEGEYISFTLVRTQPDFVEMFLRITDYIYGFHLPKIGRYPDNRPFLEFYNSNGAETEIAFHVPIR